MTPDRTNATESNEVSARETRHRKLAREAAAESIVLLHNDGVLPVRACPVALYGSGAATTIKGGTGSGEVNERYSVTIEQGLANAGFTITTGDYLREYETHLQTERARFDAELSAILRRDSADERINDMSIQFKYPSGRLITEADVKKGETGVCIYVIARQSGECADRKLDQDDYNFTQTEIDNLRYAAAMYGKLIVVINAGGSMDITPLDEIGPNAIIYFCQQGMEGGNAFADILTGAATPSGCLTSTWPEKYLDWPNAMEYSYLKGNTGYEEYTDGIYVGYRYFDSFGVKPRYEFGYGLSYTGFRIETLGITALKSDTPGVTACQPVITANVMVTNTGAIYRGKKVVQLYVSAPSGKLIREYQTLAAFAKTKILAPGQSQELTLTFSLAGLAAYDEETASFILERGDYIIRIGDSSLHTSIAAVLALDGDAVTEVCKNVCAPAEKRKEISPAVSAGSSCDHSINTKGLKPDFESQNGSFPHKGGFTEIQISAADIGYRSHDYRIPDMRLSEKTGLILSKLSIDDMLRVVCGTGIYEEPPMFTAHGAAGYTTSHLARLGVPSAALCDGPAGVKLEKALRRLKNGKIEIIAASEQISKRSGADDKVTNGGPGKEALLYQYTSAFPVGTAQAQTWNTELVGRIGNAVGAEMAEFGITYWLAPGINIQRNPLCGRNFEYYSEDPLLTGKMAAAVINGAQGYAGCYATVKHFAANNHEDNRNKSDSRMNERTLREIYLKAFRIAVEEGGVKAVMTSYNKLNGVYTPDSYDLCTNLLRCEWGFEGIVMSDWYSTGEGLGSSGDAIRAGNDLIMPGGDWYRKNIKQDLESGILKEDELRLCCARVLESVINGRTGMALGI